MATSWRSRRARGLIVLLSVIVDGPGIASDASIMPPGAVAVCPGQTIAFEGDSLTYGFDMSPSGRAEPINGSPMRRSPSPFPEDVADLLGSGIIVENRGYPGDRTRDGIERWRGAAKPSVLVVMYGTNDFGNYGGLPGGPVDVARFRADLRSLLDGQADAATAVILMTPPPLRDRVSDHALDSYRGEVVSLGRAMAVPVIDTAAVLAPISEKWTDGVHLTAAANRALARSLARLMKVGTSCNRR